MTRVLRISVWAINALLITLCAYWTAGLVLAMTRTLLAGGPPELETIAPVAATTRPSWQERRIVLDKNLFQVSTLMPDVIEPDLPPGADLDETTLPLTLVGTISSTIREEARASVRIDKDRSVVTVRIGDEVIDGATVNHIDRRRLVIDNRGNLESLTLDEDEVGAQRSAAATPRRPPARAAVRQTGRRERARAAAATPQPPANDALLRDPGQIISQARFLPRYEDGTGKLMGIGVNAVRQGSLLEDIGMRDGDTIVELNGLNIEGSEDASELLREFQDLAEIEEFEVQVVGSDGSKRTLEYSYE